jgi:hypothetical protein
MSTPFILRFEEDCLNYSAAEATAGTMTTTAVKAEQKDSDPRTQGFQALPEQTDHAGTMTKTQVNAEAPDSDPSAPPFGALPTAARIALGTSTFTFVRAEAMDSDPDSKHRGALPAWSSS